MLILTVYLIYNRISSNVCAFITLAPPKKILRKIPAKDEKFGKSITREQRFGSSFVVLKGKIFFFTFVSLQKRFNKKENSGNPKGKVGKSDNIKIENNSAELVVFVMFVSPRGSLTKKKIRKIGKYRMTIIVFAICYNS